uniref:COX6C domain-containing protein n=1 Tax=Syphacia muris TaxID=451379 RepID=A0A0N5AG49_9BILA
MRYPANAPKPLFPRISYLLEKCNSVRRASFSKIAVSTLLVLITLSIASIVSFQRSCRKKMDYIKAYHAVLLRRNADPLGVQIPFRSPFRKDN